MEPAQPATKAVCMRCTASKRPGSLITTVCTRYQGNPMGVRSEETSSLPLQKTEAGSQRDQVLPTKASKALIRARDRKGFS